MCPDSGPGKKDFMRLLNNILPICAAITIIAGGCSQKPDIESNAQTNQVVENPNPVPAAPSAPISAPIIQAQGQVDMAQLNRVARFWMLRNRRRPTDWDDFVA